MRIGIDFTSAVRQGAGIGRYTRELVRALLQQDTQSQYTLLAACGGVPSSERALRDVAAYANARTLNLPLSDRTMNVLWHRLRVPLAVECITGALDIFHSPDFSLPPVHRARTILTVHDLSFMRVPECSDPRLRAYLLRVVPASVRRADVVLADSESTRRDVIELLGVDATRVQVVYAGVERRFRRISVPSTLEAVRRRYRLPPRFVLAVGTLQPRKNYERLVEAYARVRQVPGAETSLVIAGGAGWMYQGLFRRVQELGLQGAVLFPGFVADEDLPALYSLAKLFVFPSLYEGFGLPPLEAMACGTPVVCSNVSSLPEVVGNAALAVDPLDVAALTQALQRGLSDAGLRATLVQRGLAQASRFTWSQAAARLLEVYGMQQAAEVTL
jgi:glycosyltransferase involved in cell wall biosynthesis